MIKMHSVVELVSQGSVINRASPSSFKIRELNCEYVIPFYDVNTHYFKLCVFNKTNFMFHKCTQWAFLF